MSTKLGSIYLSFEDKVRVFREKELEIVGDNMVDAFLPMCYKTEHYAFLKYRLYDLFMERVGINEKENTYTRYKDKFGFGQVDIIRKWDNRLDDVMCVRCIFTSRVCKELKIKVRNKSWIKSKPIKTIELPKDVFNVVKDYMGIYDIPQPITELMGMMKLKNLPHGSPIKKMKNLSVDERVALHNTMVIKNMKRVPEFKTAEKEILVGFCNKYPELRFGMELTDYNKYCLMKLLFVNNFMGVDVVAYEDNNSLFDFMTGECGLSTSEFHNVRKPKPYIMYREVEDHFDSEYYMENNPYDMFDCKFEMDIKDLSMIETLSWLLVV